MNSEPAQVPNPTDPLSRSQSVLFTIVVTVPVALAIIIFLVLIRRYWFVVVGVLVYAVLLAAYVRRAHQRLRK
ncbi:MAG: hypothetical protein ACRDWT_12770 [Jatrophihabitantaceae bacterium]